MVQFVQLPFVIRRGVKTALSFMFFKKNGEDLATAIKAIRAAIEADDGAVVFEGELPLKEIDRANMPGIYHVDIPAFDKCGVYDVTMYNPGVIPGHAKIRVVEVEARAGIEPASSPLQGAP